MQLDNIEALTENLTKDHDHILSYSAMTGMEDIAMMLEDEYMYESDEPMVEFVISLVGRAYGMLDELNWWAGLVRENPKVTVAQAQVIRSFESDVQQGWVAEWGLTPDIVHPPKGDGWEKYQQAKKAVGL